MVTGNTYTFVFTRAVADADDEVYTSEVSLPAPVTINSPANNATFTRGNTIAVTWTAGTTDSITVSLSGSGNSSTSSGSASFLSSDGSLADDGSHTISSEDTNPDSITGAITNGVITVTRRRSGTMDTALDGSISASTEDSVTGITLNP